MEKSVSGQKWIVFAFDTTDNTPKTGDAAQITANLRIDGAAANAVDDTNPTELEDGYYIFDLTQTETNGDYILITPVSSTANIQVIGCPAAVFTRPANFSDLGIESDGDLTKVNTLDGHTAQTGDTYSLANGTTGFTAIDTLVDAIKAKTDNLPPDPADQSQIESAITTAHSTTDGKLDTIDNFLDTEIAAILEDTGTTIPALIAALENLSATDVWAETTRTLSAGTNLNDLSVADIIAGISDGEYDLQEMLRIMFAVLAGKSSGGGTTSITFRDSGDTKNRVTATVDSNGNRTAVTLIET